MILIWQFSKRGFQVMPYSEDLEKQQKAMQYTVNNDSFGFSKHVMLKILLLWSCVPSRVHFIKDALLYINYVASCGVYNVNCIRTNLQRLWNLRGGELAPLGFATATYALCVNVAMEHCITIARCNLHRQKFWKWWENLSWRHHSKYIVLQLSFSCLNDVHNKFLSSRDRYSTVVSIWSLAWNVFEL